MVKIAIIQYSTYGHVTSLAKSIQQSIEQEGGQADIFQIPETLSDEVLALIHAPPKPSDIPVATKQTLDEYDAFLFGFSTRYGAVPSQFSSFWDSTGGFWANGTLHAKPYSLFVSTGTPGGGQEITFRNTLSSFSHHGMVYIPLGTVFSQFATLEEPHGGSAWGSGTFAGGDGSRQPTELELKISAAQGSYFYSKVKKFGISSEETPVAAAAATTTTTTTAAAATAAATEPAAAATEVKEAAAAETRKAQTATTTSPEKPSDGSKCCTIM